MHFSGVVITLNGTKEQVEKALAPHQETRWDWWQVGGRWTGALSDGKYKPEEDPKNKEVCNLCKGTGKREWPASCNAEWIARCNGCNGCQGTGIKLKWATEWQPYKGDTRLVAEIGYIPYFVLTPDGQWHEHKDLSLEKDPQWEKAVRKLYKQWDWFMGTVVDIHN